MNAKKPIKHSWSLWAVSLTRKVQPRNLHPRFLSCGKDTPVALYFERDDAVEHAKDMEAHDFDVSGIVKVKVTIEETGKPRRRGMK